MLSKCTQCNNVLVTEKKIETSLLHLISEKKIGVAIMSHKKRWWWKSYTTGLRNYQNFLLLITQLKKKVITPLEFYQARHKVLRMLSDILKMGIFYINLTFCLILLTVASRVSRLPRYVFKFNVCWINLETTTGKLQVAIINGGVWIH